MCRHRLFTSRRWVMFYALSGCVSVCVFPHNELLIVLPLKRVFAFGVTCFLAFGFWLRERERKTDTRKERGVKDEWMGGTVERVRDIHVDGKMDRQIHKHTHRNSWEARRKGGREGRGTDTQWFLNKVIGSKKKLIGPSARHPQSEKWKKSLIAGLMDN